MKLAIHIFALLFPFTLISQKGWLVTLNEVNTSDTTVINTIRFKDSLDISPYLRKHQLKLLKHDYPLAAIESQIWDSLGKNLSVYIYKGPQFEKLRINFQSEDYSIIRKTSNLSERILSHVPLLSEEIAQTHEALLKYLENNGYPFAQVGLTNLRINDTEPEADLLIIKGKHVSWTKIHIKGEPKISAKFITTYLGIREGDDYSEQRFTQIRQKINQIQFLEMEQSPQIAFTEDGAELYLYLKTNQISSANGILGIQPGDDGKVIFTGDVQLKLINLLKRGEQFDLIWKSLQPQTQQLDVGLTYPFLFKTNFGLEGNFHLYKRDSSFLELRALAGVRYYIGKGNFLRGFYRFESSNILSGAANNPLFNTGETVRTNFYGIGLIRRQVDYIPNPTRGFNLDLDFSIGLRKAYPRDTNETFRETKSTTYKLYLNAEYFIPLGNRHTIRIANLSQFFVADTIYVNEQIRFGGLNSQRGFDEEALFATSMTRFTVEYRFLLDRNSHLFAFFDQSFYENNSVGYYKDSPYGFGAGLSFGTRVGTFSISYALGSQFKNAIQFRDGKIHFGYIAFF